MAKRWTMRTIKAVLYAENASVYYHHLAELPEYIKVVPCHTEDEAIQEIQDSHVLCCTGMFFPQKIFEAAASLEWIHSISVGMEPLLHPEVVNSPVLLTNSRGGNAKPVAEHALSLILAFSRNIHKSVHAQKEKKWERTKLRTCMEIEGLTIGIIGFGAIGKELAIKAKCLGMRVIAARRHAEKQDLLIDQLFSPNQIGDLMEQSDFVVVCLPFTAETNHIIKEREFKRMKSSSYFINISRGQVVDQTALIHAIREGWIAGAGLDVFDMHPLPETSPLWDFPQVIITPYISASSPHTMKRAMNFFHENLLRFSRNAPLINQVQKKIGY